MKTYETYASDDVVFVSLTEEDASLRSNIEAWAERVAIPWSVGYGAGDTLKALEVPGYPTTFVVGRNGKVTWHSFLYGSLEDAIQRQL